MKWATTKRSIEEGRTHGEIQLILPDHSKLNEDYLFSISHTKRFLERWTADPEFRELANKDVAQAVKDYDLKINPEEIRLLWDKDTLERHDEKNPVPLSVRRYESFIREKLAYRDVLRGQTHPSNDNFKVWRARQIYRSFSELGVYKAHGIVHAPIVFELSKGCSVGCWFCGVSAQRLKETLDYGKNKELWQDILAVTREIIGEASGKGFCYWASDPMDNENYLEFIKDYHKILGNIPQTTSALPMKDPIKMREILKYSEDNNGELNRFSILTLKLLDRVHTEFTAEELLLVELVTQNKGALTGKAIAGRARDKKNKKRIQEIYGIDEPVVTSTISCVSGFLVNMVEKSIRLISPCNASDKWPLGYKIYDEAYFEDSLAFKRIINEMINKYMPVSIGLGTKLSFRKDLKFLETEKGFILQGPVSKQVYEGNDTLLKIAKLIDNNNIEVSDLALRLKDCERIELAETIHYINLLFNEGVFEDEPAWRPSPGVKANPVETREESLQGC